MTAQAVAAGVGATPTVRSCWAPAPPDPVTIAAAVTEAARPAQPAGATG